MNWDACGEWFPLRSAFQLDALADICEMLRNRRSLCAEEIGDLRLRQQHRLSDYLPMPAFVRANAAAISAIRFIALPLTLYGGTYFSELIARSLLFLSSNMILLKARSRPLVPLLRKAPLLARRGTSRLRRLRRLVEVRQLEPSVRKIGKTLF